MEHSLNRRDALKTLLAAATLPATAAVASQLPALKRCYEGLPEDAYIVEADYAAAELPLHRLLGEFCNTSLGEPYQKLPDDRLADYSPVEVIRLQPPSSPACQDWWPGNGWPLVFDLAANLRDSTFLETRTMRRLGGLSRVELIFDREANVCRFKAFCWPVPLDANVFTSPRGEHRLCGPRSIDEVSYDWGSGVYGLTGCLFYKQVLADWHVKYGEENGYWLPCAHSDGVVQDFHTGEPIACTGQFNKSRHSLLLEGVCDVLVPVEYTREVQAARERAVLIWDSFAGMGGSPMPVFSRYETLLANAGKPWQEWTFLDGEPVDRLTMTLCSDIVSVYCLRTYTFQPVSTPREKPNPYWEQFQEAESIFQATQQQRELIDTAFRQMMESMGVPAEFLQGKLTVNNQYLGTPKMG